MAGALPLSNCGNMRRNYQPPPNKRICFSAEASVHYKVNESFRDKTKICILQAGK